MPRKTVSSQSLTAAAVAWAAARSSGCGSDGASNQPGADAAPTMTTVNVSPGDDGSPTDDAASGDDSALAAVDAGATDVVVGDASDEASRAPRTRRPWPPPAAQCAPCECTEYPAG